MKTYSAMFLVSIFFSCSNILGAEWEKICNKQLGLYARFITFDNVIITACDSGIYRSTDSGKNWSFHLIDILSTPLQGDVTITATMFSKNDKYIFASTGASVYASEDSGATWNPIGPFPNGKPLWMMSIFAKDSIIFASMAGGGVFRSSNNGAEWFYFEAYRFYNYMDYKGVIFAAAMDGLWFSSDLGLTWNLCGGFNIQPSYISVNSIALKDEYIFACAWDKIYYSDDLGVMFYLINTDLPSSDSTNISIIYAYNNTMFAGLTNNKLYCSNDAESWNNISEGLDTANKVIWFGTSGKKLLVSKNGYLWSHNLSQLTGANDEQAALLVKFELLQNYPNPFNPATKIKYTVPSNAKGEMSNVKLMIYDILGNEIKTIVNKEQSPGEYEVEFDGSKLSSGIYFYVLKAGSNLLTRKMCLLK